MEDPVTLKAAMEASLKSTISTMSSRNTARITTKNFLNAVSAVVCRDPLVFLDAAANSCRVTPGGANVYLARQASTEVGEPEEADKEKEGSEEESEKARAAAASSSTSSFSTPTTATDKEKEAMYRSVFNVIISALTRPDPQPKVEDPKADPESSTTAASAATTPSKEAKTEASMSHKKEKPVELPKAEFLPISKATLLQLIVDFVCSYPQFTHVLLQHTFSPPLSSTSAANAPLDNVVAYLLEEFVPHTRPPSAVTDEEKVSDIIANEELVRHNALATRIFVAMCARPAGRERVVREVCTALRRKTSEGHNDSKYYSYIRCIVDLVCIITTRRCVVSDGVRRLR